MAIERMKKIFIIGEKEAVDEVLNFVQQKNLFHVNFINEGGKNLKTLEEEKRKNVVKLLEGCKDLEKRVKDISDYENLPEDMGKIEKRILNIIRTYKKINDKIKEKEREYSLYERYYEIIKYFLPFLEEKNNKEIFGVMVPKEDEVSLRKVILRIKKELEFKTISKDFKEYRGYIFIIDKENFEKLKELITSEGFPEIVFPEEIREMGFRDAIHYLNDKLKSIPEDIRSLKEDEERLISENGRFLKSSIDFLKDLYGYYEVKDRGILFTEFLFYIEGYIPFREYESFKKELNDKFSQKAILIEEKIDPHKFEEVPVKLKNSIPFKYFQTLIEFFSLPKYGTIDPSLFLFIFFPIYFGFMLGDIGYGLVFFFFFLFLYHKSKSYILKNLSIIFIFCMIWTIIFGFIYGEMFGNLGEKIGLHPYFHRIEKPEILLSISIIFGIGEVSLGLFLGFLNKMRLKHIKHALANLSMLFGLWSLLSLGAGFLNLIPKSFTLPLILLFASFAILSAILHGVIAPIEIFSSFAHVLSFARLMAIGLSSAILPMIANSFKNLFPIIIIGIFAMLLFHILAIILGIFDPTIQGLRLQFVEFFTKFYEAGGREYKPFLKRFKGG